MLTSKDTNFIGYTFKKSDILKSLESSGMQIMMLDTIALQDCNFGLMLVYLVICWILIYMN